MVTEEIMKSGELYDSTDADLYELQWRYNDLMYEFNQTRPSNRRKQQERAASSSLLFGRIGGRIVILGITYM